MRRAGLALAIVVVLGACDTPPPDRAGGPSPDPTPSAPEPTERAAARPPTWKPPFRLYVEARGEPRRHVRRAIHDLKSISLWEKLTDELFILRIETKPGRLVPRDGHLADAGLATHVDPTGAGRYCNIRIWPAALARDLANQRSYYAEGRLGFVPPSERVFWASILGHELAHCRGHRRVTPEEVALEWENRVRARLSAELES